LINRKYYLENNHDKYSVYNQGYENYSPNSNDFLRIDSVGYNPKGFLTICLTFFKEGCCCDFCEDTNHQGTHYFEIPSTFFTNNQGLLSNLQRNIDNILEKIAEREKIKKQKEEEEKIIKQKKEEEKEYQHYLKLHEKYKNKTGEIL
jgi:hypothetical protein